MANSKHLSKTAEQYTPLDYVARGARVVGGTIDLDPATTEAVNIEIGANHIFTKRDDALKQRWDVLYDRRRLPSNVWLNPPGGQFSQRESKRQGTHSKQAAFWRKLMEEFHAGRVRRAVFLSFSIELLQACQRIIPPGSFPLDFPWCIPRKRIKFERIVRGKRVVGKQPSHANILIFPGCSFKAVVREFGDLGQCGRGNAR